jgi:[acyl-carrier-protein] S-malonyltransferase
LGYDLAKLCAEGPEPELTRTDRAQVAIFVTSAACAEALRARGELTDPPAALAGLSLGEFTALHLAGALSFEDALRLVEVRGRAMQEAAESSRGGMVALTGADEESARALCEKASAASGEVLVPANLNCPGQVVVSGGEGACRAAAEGASEAGLKATPLSVAGAFHSPLMAPAAERLREALDAADWSAPRATVVANVTARPHGEDVSLIKQRLVEQLTSPVRWSDSMQWLHAEVDGAYAELAPNKVLTGLMRRIERSRKVRNYDRPA